MKKIWSVFIGLLLGVAFLALPQAMAAHPKIVAKLAKKLLYGDQPTRVAAVKAFNKLPTDAQYELVPDFMVAMGDDDPEVRKIASRILKAMGLTSAAEIPDAKKELPRTSPTAPSAAKQQLADEKKSEGKTLPDIRQLPPAHEDLPPSPVMPVKATGNDAWSDLKQMRGDETGNYADLKQEIDREKKGQVTLNMAELNSDSSGSAASLSTVLDSLKDPDPWVRSQAARRLALIHPAPIETLPTLIGMLGDKNADVRRSAAAALGSFGPLAREAIPALNTALSDPDTSVSLIAADALKAIQQRP